VVRPVEVQDHDHVAVDAVDALRAQAVGGVLLVSAQRDVEPIIKMFSDWAAARRSPAG